MAACILFWAGLGWWAATMAVQWISAGLGRWRRPADPVRHGAADFSIVAPMVGVRDASPAYVRRLADLSRAGAEVLICVTSEDDEAVGRTRAEWPDAPILVGSDDTFNPKLNNVRKGLEAASRPVVALCDAGIDLTLAELAAAAAHLSDKVGLVLALKTGDRPENFAAEMECSYINGHQARFLTAADRLGMPVASGGVTILTQGHPAADRRPSGFPQLSCRRLFCGAHGARPPRPDDLAGGCHAAAARRRPALAGRVAAAGPLGIDAAEAQPRGEGAGAAGARDRLARVGPRAGRGAACRRRRTDMACPRGRPSIHVAWLAAEGWFLAGRGLPFGPRAWAAALAREALVPLLAAQAWLGRNRIDWRGTNLAAGWQPARDGTAGKHV